jgi:hypothetical protein
MPVGDYGATDVYMLINTIGGQPGPNSYAWLIFTGSRGATYTDYLAGNTDIRDYNLAWDNSINGTTTVNVFNCPSDNDNGPGVLDMQHIVLPGAFATQTLSTIQVVDNGNSYFQRVVVDGVTVESVPEPSTFVLLSVATISLLGYAWRKR